MTAITIKGKAYSLTFDMEAWEQIEEELGTVDSLRDLLAGRERIRAVRTTLRILSGGEITDDVFRRGLRPGQLADAIGAIWAAIGEGMSMETGEGEDGEETDVTLEEIEKKDAGAD